MVTEGLLLGCPRIVPIWDHTHTSIQCSDTSSSVLQVALGSPFAPLETELQPCSSEGLPSSLQAEPASAPSPHTWRMRREPRRRPGRLRPRLHGWHLACPGTKTRVESREG